MADFIRLKLNFIKKNKKKSFLSHSLGDLGVTYALHLLLFEKPVVDFLFVIFELFSLSLRLRRYKRKSVEVGVFLSGVGHWAEISDGMGRRPPTTVGVRIAEWLPFGVVSKYPQCIVWFCHKARCDRQTDRQTDGQNYDSHDRASIAASRGENVSDGMLLLETAEICPQLANHCQPISCMLQQKVSKYKFHMRVFMLINSFHVWLFCLSAYLHRIQLLRLVSILVNAILSSASAIVDYRLGRLSATQFVIPKLTAFCQYWQK